MAGFGDYKHFQAVNSDKTTDFVIGSGGTGTIVPKSAKHRVYLQKITYSITTHAAGKYLQANDGTITTAKIIDQTAAAGVPDEVTVDFGPKGRAMTLGATVTISSEASGPAADVHVECYEKLDATVSYLAGSALQ